MLHFVLHTHIFYYIIVQKTKWFIQQNIWVNAVCLRVFVTFRVNSGPMGIKQYTGSTPVCSIGGNA